ncbi:response regulator transcription factor [Arcobacter sp. FWKO B]|uniref:response regulator transcription factor n=1 Tax=Arcobacter sp. FWKO B TaxID=2593672 RepID=UPI0018A523CC|nr:response regulator transcription factor [Arcobacter sp. FWKO B]QOG12361.1 response regulator transcription factor [Arcobacter sp. FWKO B]
MSKTILMVEDEEDILELVEYTLSKIGYEVIGCLDTKNVQAILDEEKIDLILMDRNLPGVDGANFIELLRAKGYNTPVIYLTAKTAQSDILEGFEKGGDDYITKPFDTDELQARVKAVIKRSSKEAVIIKARDIVYNFDSKKFKIDDKDIDLTHLEHDLLLEFIKNKDILLSREQLLENVWKDSYEKQLKTVNVAIKRLKEKIDPNGEKEYIKAVRGEGYIFC